MKLDSHGDVRLVPVLVRIIVTVFTSLFLFLESTVEVACKSARFQIFTRPSFCNAIEFDYQTTFDPSDFGSRQTVCFRSYNKWKLPLYVVSVKYFPVIFKLVMMMIAFIITLSFLA